MIFLNPHPSAGKNIPATLTTRYGSAVFISQAADAKYYDSPAETSSVEPSNPIICHPEFFLDDILITIQIENTLFKVHKYQLAKSELFSKIFKMPRREGDKPEEGSSREHPIIIRGAVASDFTALLKVLYASYFSSRRPALEASLIVPAFRLAHLLSFSELRACLLPLVEANLNDVDKIVFAWEFDLKEWLAPAHIRLCKREEHLSIEEARKLGVESVLIISRMREKHRIQSSSIIAGSYYCSICTGLSANRGSANCDHCKANWANLYCRSGPGTMEIKPNTNDSSLEAEMKKWVEDSFTLKG